MQICIHLSLSIYTYICILQFPCSHSWSDGCLVRAHFAYPARHVRVAARHAGVAVPSRHEDAWSVCCIVLHCVAMCCNVLQRVCCSVAVCCSVLQCAAVCCSVLQCVAVCCSVLQCVAVQSWRDDAGSVCSHCVTWHIHMSEMTHLYVWHAMHSYVRLDASISVTGCFQMYTLAHSYVWSDVFICMPCEVTLICVLHDVVICVNGGCICSCAWRDLFICMTWHFYKCDWTYLYIWYDWFMRVTKLHVRHVHMCDKTQSDICHV